MNSMGDMPAASEAAAISHDDFSLNNEIEMGQENNPQAEGTATQPSTRRPDLWMLFTILFLALVLIGPRYLDGSGLIIVFVGAFIARWLYSKWRAGPATG